MSYFPADRARGIDWNLKILKKTKQLNHFARENSNKRKVQAPNLSTAKIVYLPNLNQITYHFHNKSSRVSVDAPWSELSVSNTNTDTPSLSPFCLQINDGENSITVGLELVKITGEMQLEHEKPVGKFQPGKRDYLLSSSNFSGNFPVG